MKHIGWAVLLGALVVAAPPSGAVTPQTWRTAGVEDWQETSREGVGITSEGGVRLAYSVRPLGESPAFVVWDLLRDGNRVLAATGDGGTLYEVRDEEAWEAVATVVQPEITALGRDGRGRILLGAAPDGTVYRLEGDAARPVADTPEAYIWRILPHGGSGALVATGSAGRIYRMDADGALDLLADLQSQHVTGLETRGEGWVATTDGPGRLLEVDASGTTRVLYDAQDNELRAPVLSDDGSIFFLGNPTAGGNGNGRVFRWSPGGAVEPLWTSRSGFVYSLHLDDRDALWVSTGADTGAATLVRIEPGPPTTWVEMLKVEEPQLVTALFDEDGPTHLATGGMGRVYAPVGSRNREGTVTGTVQDAGGSAAWGALSIEPATLGGIGVDTRSGNTRVPDATWSDWETVSLQAGRGVVPSEPGRFLQWRVTMEDPEATLGGVSVVYLPANLAPRIQVFQVTGLGAPIERTLDAGPPASLSQVLPGGARVEFQPSGSRGSPGDADDAEATWVRRFRVALWGAQDPNDDPLRYEVALRPVDTEAWTPLAEDVDADQWVWDSSTVPDGWYQMRLTASDERANPPARALRDERVLEAFPVDNTPPRIRDLQWGGGNVRGIAEDAATPIKRLEFAVDGREWKPVYPDDGIPDMPIERFTIPLADLDPGRHLVQVRAFDQAGNPASDRIEIDVP